MKNTENVLTKIALLKKLIDSISAGSTEKLSAFKTQLGGIKEQKYSLDIETGEEGSPDKFTLAEYAIQLLLENSRSNHAETETLLSVIDEIFAQIPELIAHTNSRTKRPLLHLVVYTPLQEYRRSKENVRELLTIFFKHRANFNIQDHLRQTVAHVAVNRNNFMLLPNLVQCGCGINRLNIQKQTPLDVYLARRTTQTSIIEMMRDEGAETSDEVLKKAALLIETKLDRAVKEREKEVEAELYKIFQKNPEDVDAYMKSFPSMAMEVETNLAQMGTLDVIRAADATISTFDPNYVQDGVNITILAIHNQGGKSLQEKNEIGIMLFKRYLRVGLDLSFKLFGVANIFQILAGENRLSAFLADKTIRAALLSSTRFTTDDVLFILDLEKHELAAVAKLRDQEEERSKAAEKLQIEKRKLEIKALIKEKNKISTEDKAKKFILNILVRAGKEKFANQQKTELFKKNQVLLSAESWRSILSQLREITDEQDPRIQFVIACLRSDEPKLVDKALQVSISSS